MPNWCECELRISVISGRKDKEAFKKGIKNLREFKKFGKTGNNCLDTEKFIPYPEKFRKMDERAKAEKDKWMKMSAEERKNIAYQKEDDVLVEVSQVEYETDDGKKHRFSLFQTPSTKLGAMYEVSEDEEKTQNR